MTERQGRATASTTSVDVSGNTRRTSPVPVRRFRIEPCACGGAIRADVHSPALYVAAHNRSLKHQDWRAVREYGDYLWEIRLEGLPA